MLRMITSSPSTKAWPKWMLVVTLIILGLLVLSILVYSILKSSFRGVCIRNVTTSDNYQTPCCLQEGQLNGLRIEPYNNFILASQPLYPTVDVCQSAEDPIKCAQMIDDPCNPGQVGPLVQIGDTYWFPISTYPSTLCTSTRSVGLQVDSCKLLT